METKTFEGGAHIPHYKSYTEDKSITVMESPDEVIIPMVQHGGAPCEPLVKSGDKVEMGQKIGDSEEYVSAPVHTSVGGTVKAVEPRPYYDGSMVESVVIETDHNNIEFKPEVERNPEEMDVEELKEAIKEAGLVGMGGAAFPTFVNINQSQPIDTLLLNGAECEPFLTCDHRQMAEQTQQLIAGAKIIMRIIGANNCYVGIEVNKPDAIEAVKKAIGDDHSIEVVPLAVKYPQGFKSHLIKAITGRNVPRGARSAELGCIVRNVGTTIAAYEAVVYGKPLIERVVTVSGPKISKPGNYLIKIGTPVGFALQKCGVNLEQLDNHKVIVGGPMTGLAQDNLEVPLIKSNTGLLVLPPEMIEKESSYADCVRCGECVSKCPIWLYPNMISTFAEAMMLEEAKSWNIDDCIECGICAFSCVANRPIVELIQRAKIEIKKLERQKA